MTTMQTGSQHSSAPTPAASSPAVSPERDRARKRLAAKRELLSHLVSYLVINGFLIVAWLVTGGGYFWPGWVLTGWGIGLVLHAWDVFWRRPITEADIDAELRRR